MAAAAFIAISCSNADTKKLERRVEILEEKVAALSTVSQAKAGNENIVASNSTEPAGDLPAINFESKEFDFGTIKEGAIVKHTFKFTNTGKAPLLIQNAAASCGCTVPKWPKNAIGPGQSGEIEVQFDSKGKTGMQNKTVSITANTNPSLTTINIKTNVLADNSADNSKGPLKN